MTSTSYNNLIQKLDLFTRKYYANQMIRGSLYFVGFVVSYFLIINLLEGSFYFSKGMRKVLFYSWLLMGAFAAYRWLIDPMIKMLKLGKTISHEQAASIIGDHFYDVKDKLLNILQLKSQYDAGNGSELLMAGISQKTEAIKLVPFQKAIDFSKNKKYVKYALPPVLCLVGLFFMSPSLIKNSTYRLLNNNEDFEKEAPFHFTIENENLKATQYADFVLNVNVDGDVLPAEVFLDIDGFSYRLEKKSANNFEYTFRNVQKEVNFYLKAGEVSSDDLTLEVLPKPHIANFSTLLDYPAYTQKDDEKLSNVGDLIIPEGTNIKWNFITDHTDNIALRIGDNVKEAPKTSEDEFEYRVRAMDNFQYGIYLSNEFQDKPDSLLYTVSVIKDQYPTINVETIVDSLNKNAVLFDGELGDDYGLSRLTFNYTITDEKGKLKATDIKKLSFEAGRNSSFRHLVYWEDFKLAAGDKLEYYFEVFDNDGVHGSKSAKSGLMTFSKLTKKELEEKQDANEEEIKDKLRDANKDIKKMDDRFQKMKEKLLQKKQLDWQDKKELEKLLEEQKKLQEKLQKANEKFEENLQNQQELDQPKEEIKEKQDKLKEMMEEAANEENKELIEKIQELLQELEKEDALKMMDEFKMQNENLEKKTERLLELYKQLEMEKEVGEQIEKLNELGEKQEELAKKTEEKETPKEDLLKEQKEINKEFEQIKKDLEELEKKNEELSPPKDMGDDNQEKMEDIKEDMDDATKDLEKQDSKGASKSQKSAGQKMKSMAGNMQASMEGGDMEQHTEDLKTIRQILENLVTLSFDQEALVKNLRETQVNTPKFVDLVKEQFKIKDEFQIIEDSLTELSKRVAEIESFVGEKVTEVKYNMSNSIELLEERIVGQANDKQRRTMTNLNDLALMLSESMENMQQQMAGGMPGSQNCAKPGGTGKGQQGKGRVPMDKISEGQQGMDEALEGLKQKMGKGKEGKEGPTAKDFAEAAARQAALRKALQDLKKEKQEQGKGAGDLEGIIDQMDKIETDLVNRRLDAETLKRQKDIVTRLLEAEKAERQRGEDEKRKSESAQDMKQELPPAIQDYLKQRASEVEMYKTVSPALKPYYKMLVDQYYQQLKKG